MEPMLKSEKDLLWLRNEYHIKQQGQSHTVLVGKTEQKEEKIKIRY